MDGVRAVYSAVTMPREMTEELSEAFRAEMAQRFGLYVTPSDARSVWAGLVRAQLREAGK